MDQIVRKVVNSIVNEVANEAIGAVTHRFHGNATVRWARGVDLDLGAQFDFAGRAPATGTGAASRSN
jgi:hypothetical protein